MNKKLGLCCMVAALSTKISFAACISGTWYDRFDTEFADQPTLGDYIDYDMLWEGLEEPNGKQETAGNGGVLV